MEQPFEKLERASVPDLDAILGTPFKVLQDGFVRVIDYMGSDAQKTISAIYDYNWSKIYSGIGMNYYYDQFADNKNSKFKINYSFQLMIY